MRNVIKTPTGELEIFIERGATFRLAFTLTQPVDVNNPRGARVPVDLTGAIPRLVFPGSQQVAWTTTSTGGVILFQPAQGKMTLFAADEDTVNFNFQRTLGSLRIEFSNGDVRTLLRGFFSSV